MKIHIKIYAIDIPVLISYKALLFEGVNEKSETSLENVRSEVVLEQRGSPDNLSQSLYQILFGSLTKFTKY